MKQEFILNQKRQCCSEILVSLCNYIIEHQNDYIEDERVYEYMRIITCVNQYLLTKPYVERVFLLLKKIDKYSYPNKEKYKIMMQLLNLFLFNENKVLSLEDNEICKIANKLKDVKAIDINTLLEKILNKQEVILELKRG